MSLSLLSTKLYIPPVRAGAVDRPHLVEKLLDGLAYPGSLILLSGPAGFGKTTLLSEFAARIRQMSATDVRVAWFSLDQGDNDPGRFWSYMITACQSVLSEVGDTAMALLRTSQPGAEEAIPTLLINDLSGQRQSLVLVLDDFHGVQNPSIQAGVTFLIDHLPQNLHLVVSTRTDPPWPLARYRARNRLIEIRAQDLRFTLAEAADFLHHTMGLALSAQALEALEDRTEGWIAGLQLAALSLQGRGDVGAFIQAFTGSHVFIAEYLVDEVLKQQPEEMQAFLLQTSILDRLSGSLCEAVTGLPNGQNKLKTLQQANIFILPLDDEGLWFRYHHLFADLLQSRLQSSQSKTDICSMHQRAAQWYEQNGMITEAINHAITAADYPNVVRMVEAVALPMILQAYVRSVEYWLQAIPGELIEKSPRINMAYAWMNLLRGTPLQAAPFIDRLRAMFSAPDPELASPSLQAEWLAIQAEELIAQRRLAESRDLAIRAQQMLPEVDSNVRSMTYVTLAKAYQLTLDYDRAAEVFQMIVEDARRIGDMTFEVLGTSGQAQMVLKQGRLHQTFAIASEGIRRLEMSGKKVPFSATLYGELGQVFFQWRQYDRAREYLRRSMEISGKSGYSDPEIYLHIVQSKMCRMEGDLDGFIHEMEQASHLASLAPPVMIRENVIAQQVRVNLATNRPTAAEQLLAADQFLFGDTFRFPDLVPGAPVLLEAGMLYNSALRVLIYQANKGKDPAILLRGINLAERVLQGELQGQHLPVALETLLLLSQMYALVGQPEQSLAAAGRAVTLAEPEGFISVFIEEGKPVADILTTLLEGHLPEKVQPAYVQQILAAYQLQPHSQAEPDRLPAAKSQPGSIQPLVEPLSARELEVLRLIAVGDSNQAIAEKLVITVSAVKKHTGNIYGKLNVNSRTQAVSRARQLGLLSPDS